MKNNKAALSRAATLYPLNHFSQAIKDLSYKRQTIFDLAAALIDDDFKFANDNPDHPCAFTNRFKRMTAANFFSALVEGNASCIDSETLEGLHRALFDRCYSIRLSIVEALGKLARHQSIWPLQRLIEAEDEGQDIRDTAKRSAALCKVTERSRMRE